MVWFESILETPFSRFSGQTYIQTKYIKTHVRKNYYFIYKWIAKIHVLISLTIFRWDLNCQWINRSHSFILQLKIKLSQINTRYWLFCKLVVPAPYPPCFRLQSNNVSSFNTITFQSSFSSSCLLLDKLLKVNRST